MEMDELVREGRTIQKQLRAFTTRNLTEEEQDGRNAKIFCEVSLRGEDPFGIEIPFRQSWRWSSVLR